MTREARGRVARGIVWLCLIVAVAAPALVALAVAGRVFGALSWETAFQTLTLGVAQPLATVGAVAGLAAAVAAVWARPRSTWFAAVAALGAAGMTLAVFAGYRAQAERAPPIHDVSTNWDDPVNFSDALVAQRGRGANPVRPDPQLERPWVPTGAVSEAWAPRSVAEINQRTCPGARPIGRLVEQARVQRVLQDHGLVVSGAAPWRVEGTWRSTWFHARDDVAVRMRPGRTDVRSVSREGEGDQGRNCARVTSIVRAMEAER